MLIGVHLVLWVLSNLIWRVYSGARGVLIEVALLFTSFIYWSGFLMFSGACYSGASVVPIEVTWLLVLFFGFFSVLGACVFGGLVRTD